MPSFPSPQQNFTSLSLRLQVLNLSGCSQLHQLPTSIGDLASLERLTLTGCSQLQLPASLGKLISLEMLDLSGCTKFWQMPDSIGSLNRLTKLR